ncbi:RDD family protein [Spirulina sp. CS-785/01]|uniref:RDD family protein n=1 Tax=Spirulina sp. CS-785/01 TaxID=3021716 RepID=UPI00232D5F99|nr:RDD family protein [Spirulina sp. CS-785/01]MDB9312867.1 RDD family protein [Spirulina sp. CS-785/01]
MTRPVPKRFPRVPAERRFWAFVIDFVLTWLVSSFVGNWFFQGLVFLVLWGVNRVVVVDRNEGQSLGSWCMDIKVLDLQYRKVPDIFMLAKREGVLGGLALLAMAGFNVFFLNPFSTLLLVSPVIIDCGIAYADDDWNQTFHDRLVGTVKIQTQRGISLDIQVRRLLDEVRYRMRR